MVMLGCSAWKLSASFFIAGLVPTQDENVTVTGDVGSGTGPFPFPAVELELSSLLPPHPAATRARTVAPPTSASDRRETAFLTDLLLTRSGAGHDAHKPPPNRLANPAKRARPPPACQAKHAPPSRDAAQSL